MKAVRQVIDYLRERGVLTLDQLKFLAVQGFLPWEEVFGADELTEEPEPRPRVIFEEDEHDRDVPRPRAGTGKKVVAHKGVVFEPEEINARLAEGFEEWAAALEGLVRLAGRIEPCASFDEAAVAIRNAEPEALVRAVTEGLAARDPSLGKLWTALSMEAYRGVVDDPGAHGPAVTAYRAMLEAADPSQLGKHTWLLKEEHVGRVANLKRAQRLVLEAASAAYAAEPDLLATSLRDTHVDAAYWAFVLLYSSRRGRNGPWPAPSAEERWPPRDPPDELGWMRAWAHAIVMDPVCGPPFLIQHNQRQSQRPGAVSWALTAAIANLKTTPADLLALVDRFGFPSCDEPAADSDTDADAAPRRTLCEALATLRAEVERASTLAIPADADAIRTWESFLETWLRQAARRFWDWELEQLTDRAFGPTTGLLCPRAWDRRGWA